MRKKEKRKRDIERRKKRKRMIMRLIHINTDRNSNEGDIIRLSEET